MSQLPTLMSMQSVLASHVEGYVAASSKLTALLVGPMDEKLLLTNMIFAAQARVNDGLATRSMLELVIKYVFVCRDLVTGGDEINILRTAIGVGMLFNGNKYF